MRLIPLLFFAGCLSLATSPSSAYQSATIADQALGPKPNLLCSTRLHERLRLDIIVELYREGYSPRGFESADVSYLIRVLRLDSDRWKDLAHRIELRLKQGEQRCIASH